MIGWLSARILRLFGWRTSGNLPEGISQAVMIVAPHTSYWDFVVGRLTFWASGVKIRVLIKSEVFFFPLGPFLKWLGGVPVARGRKNNMIDQVVDLFRENKDLVVVITPEGTRRMVKQWKKGFYKIASEAKVPIALAFIDYSKKAGGVGPLIHPSGDFKRDMQEILNFYRGMTGRHPDRFFLSDDIINTKSEDI
jgi:1-acyl-sn-glycerol-3-phosphate acyltransferase